MRALVIPKAGEPEVMQLVERPTPVPRAGEVAIDVEYCGCNWADTMMRRNTYPHPVSYPVAPGFEVSGHVRTVGEGVVGIREGDRVAVEFEGNAVTCEGKPYCNQYCMVFTLRDGKIKQVNEYFCTKLADDVLYPAFAALEQR